MEQKRSCDGCVACCITHDIETIGKAAHTACPRCTEDGCRIYGDHPEACALYKCAYLLGETDLWLDDSGFVEDKSFSDLLGHVWSMSEATEGAFDSLVAQVEIAKRLQEGYAVGLEAVSGLVTLIVPEGKRLSRLAQLVAIDHPQMTIIGEVDYFEQRAAA